MTYGGLVSTFSLASSAFEIGNDMYFRKDSFFYDYLEENYEEWRNYVNTERTFCFFGKIWPVTNEDGVYNILFEGMKDYMTEALPVHNRTERLTELIKLWFDDVNHEPYNMTKYQWSLLDAREVDTRWLQYIANIYGIEINDDLLTELPLREWVDFLIYFIKRIGAYNALYIVWNVFASQTTNAFNVYERWDEWCKTSGIPSFSEFPNFHPGITSTQYDFHWLEHYGISPSGGSGIEWYNQFVPSGHYPYPSTPYPVHALSASCPSSASMVISPHYVVEVDLSTQPLGDVTIPQSDEIISEIRATELVRNWNYTKPVGKTVQYQELIAPLAQEDRTGDSIGLYPNTSLGYCETYYVASQYLVNDSPTPSGGEQVYVHIQQYDSDSWSFTHDLSGSVMAQAWEVDGTGGYTRVIPNEITILSDIAIQLDFDDPISGIAVVAGELSPITDVTNIITPSAGWYIDHGLATAAPSGYPSVASTDYWSSAVKIIPSAATLITSDLTTAEWNSAVSGSAFSRLVDYEHTQAVASATWTVNHNMNSLGPITHTFDTVGEYVSPIDVVCTDGDTMEITFNSATAGTAQLIYAPRDFIAICDDPLDIMDNCISPNSGWWEVGNGATESYDPFITNQLESTTASGAYWRVWEDTTTWYIDFIVPEGENLSITEVGLFNANGTLIYYTKCSQLYKTEEMQTVFHYRSQKLEITESSSSSSSSVSSSSSSESSSISSSSSSESSSSTSSSSESSSSTSSSSSSSESIFLACAWDSTNSGHTSASTPYTFSDNDTKFLMNFSISPDSGTVLSAPYAEEDDKFYLEMRIITNAHRVGIANEGYDPNKAGHRTIGDDAYSWAWLLGSGNVVHNSITEGNVSPFPQGFQSDLVMIAVDCTNLSTSGAKIYFGLNGAWSGSGNPSAGTNPAFSNLYGDRIYATTSTNIGGNSIAIYLDSSDWTYSAPTGYSQMDCVDVWSSSSSSSTSSA